MSDFDAVVADLDEDLVEWVIRRAKHPVEMPTPGHRKTVNVLPAAFPIVVDERTGTICEPILFFIYDSFLKEGASGYVQNTALAYCFDVKEWMVYLEDFGLTWTQATRFNLNSYFKVLKTVISPQTGKRYATETLNRRQVGIESFYEWGRNRKLAADDTPEDGLLRTPGERGERFQKRAKENGPVSVLQTREAKALFSELGPEPSSWDSNNPGRSCRDWVAADIALNAGLRVSEVGNLRVSQLARHFKMSINPLRRYRIRITGKGGVTRTTKFPGELINDLKAYVEGERDYIVRQLGDPASDYLLLNPTSVPRYAGKRVSSRTLERAFASACVRSGLFTDETTELISWGRDGLVRVDKVVQSPLFVFHDLRHTYAVWTYYKLKKYVSEPWLDIQACLGHADLKTTLRFYLRCASDFEASVSDAYMETVNAI